MRKRGLVGQDASEEFDSVVLFIVACFCLWCLAISLKLQISYRL